MGLFSVLRTLSHRIPNQQISTYDKGALDYYVADIGSQPSKPQISDRNDPSVIRRRLRTVRTLISASSRCGVQKA
jgi:hypothetical protein